ncbi:MAG: ribonuclease III [Alloprevotella sp.]|nr:ribonuclease III [Alloprevotella sp.]
MKLSTEWYDRIRLLFREDKELYSSLYAILGFYPRNIDVYRTALTHSSTEERNKVGRPLNNERLEFLGDAVLETVVSDIVFHRFERKREGFLTGTRSKLVQRSTLNQLAEKMGLVRLLRCAAQTTTVHNNIGGNAFEALMGAIYLDRGYAHCKLFVERQVLGRYVNLNALARKEENFKSKVLEWSQKNRLRTDFQVEESGPKGKNGVRQFRTSVVVEGITVGQGVGASKKESHQKASRDALNKLRKDSKFRDSIFRAKEKRTSMEAEEFAAVPTDEPDVVVK